MMKRKLLSLFLAVWLIAGLLPAVMGSAETSATEAPTTAPTSAPISSEPTSAPTSAPTTEPTTAPSTESTVAPSSESTSAPTTAPTTATTAPTTLPATVATTAPTTAPTAASTAAPTTAPTTKPTAAPTAAPTATPTVASTGASAMPTLKPTEATASTTRVTTPATQATRPSTAATTPIGVTLNPTTAPSVPEPSGVIDPTTSAVSVSIKLCETSTTQSYLAVLTVSKGGAPVYATTNEAGIPIPVTDGSIPADNYIKFEYPENDLPTITLMNAKLRSSGNILDLSSFDIAVKIMVVGDSTIESTTKCGIVRKSYGDITILGPNTLTLNCYSSAIAFEGDSYANSLVLKELTLKATTSANATGRVLQIPAGNLTVDGCSLDLINRAGIAVFLGQGNVADAKSRGNVTISNSVVTVNSKNASMQMDGNMTVMGSSMQLASDARTLFCGGNLTANNSTLFLEGRSNTLETVSVGGEFTLQASNAEISGTRYAIFDAATTPKLIGEYTVVAGMDRASATTYDEALIGTYQYFFAESVVHPTDLPTAPTGTESDPTEFFTEATVAPTISPTAAPTGAPGVPTVPTLPIPTAPANNASGGNSVLFWVLAIVMILGACGAATMAILMLRKNANTDFDEDEDEIEEESNEVDE